MLLDARSVTALRTGAVAAVAAAGARASPGARTVGIDRLRPARGVGRALPRRRRLRARRLLRPQRRGRRRARGRARLGAGLARARRSLPTSSAASRPGAQIVVDAGDLRPGPAPQHARRRRPGQGRGDVGRGRRVRAVLRRVGAGLARRRADRRRCRPGCVAREQVTELGAVLAGDARRARRTPRRSRCSTRPAWRSRTSPSPRPRSGVARRPRGGPDRPAVAGGVCGNPA